MSTARILVGDALTRLREMEGGSVQTCITSPPYWGLRDYGHDGQIGLEESPHDYVKELVRVFQEVRRVLSDDGVLWLNLGDTYSTGSGGGRGAESKQSTSVGSLMERVALEGVAPKNLLGLPWRVAFALQDDGWYLRSDIIWAKPNPMPESVKDRCTKSHEYLFMLAKSERYLCDMDAIKEEAVATSFHDFTTGGNHDVAPGQTAQGWARSDMRSMPRFGGTKYGDSDDPAHATMSGNEYQFTGTRNKRDVWNIATEPFKGAHFAVMPTKLVEPCVLAGSREGDTVLDPFCGSGTVGVVALRHQRNFIGVEINGEYAAMARARIKDDAPLLNEAVEG